MLGSAIIVFREALEAALIIGIIAAATRNLPGRNFWLLAGIAAGLIGSVILASLTSQIAELAEGAVFFNLFVEPHLLKHVYQLLIQRQLSPTPFSASPWNNGSYETYKCLTGFVTLPLDLPLCSVIHVVSRVAT